MKIIEPSVELINPPPYETALKTIEIAGRTCYQSGDKMTDGSAEDFIRLRCGPAAHPQMQQAANMAKEPLILWGSVFFEDLEV